MTHFALATSPFGNFAAYAREDGNNIVLIPVGGLTEVPTTDTFVGTTGINHDALTAEARRQLSARGVESPKFLNPRPEFTVNRVQYTSELEVITRTYHGDSHEHTFIQSYTGGSLTDSARDKINAWWLEVRESILTAEFWAHTEWERAKSANYYAERDTSKARAELAKAEQKSADAMKRLEEASAALDAIGK